MKNLLTDSSFVFGTDLSYWSAGFQYDSLSFEEQVARIGKQVALYNDLALELVLRYAGGMPLWQIEKLRRFLRPGAPRFLRLLATMIFDCVACRIELSVVQRQDDTTVCVRDVPWITVRERWASSGAIIIDSIEHPPLVAAMRAAGVR